MSLDPQKMMKMAAQMQADMARAQEALGQERVGDVAGVVDRHVADELGQARFGVDLDDGHVGAEGEGGASLHGVERGQQRIAPALPRSDRVTDVIRGRLERRGPG